MGQGVIAPAAEGPAPMFAAAPPDQQPQDLAGALAMVKSMLFRDGGLDQNEQRLFSAWVQDIMMTAEATQAAAAQGATPGQSPDQQAGLGSSSANGEAQKFGNQEAVQDAPGYGPNDSFDYQDQ